MASLFFFTISDLSPVFVIDTGEQYVAILEEVLLPSVRAMALPAPERIYLVQDNSPIHKSRIVNNWFNDHEEFVRLVWPPRSPDFNPIEELWAYMVNEWNNGDERNARDLMNHCRAVWESMRHNQRMCEQMVRSMPDRIQECVEAGGGHTRY